MIFRWQAEDSLYLDVVGGGRKYSNIKMSGVKECDCGKRRLLSTNKTKLQRNFLTCALSLLFVSFFDRLKDEDGMTSIRRHFKADNKEPCQETKSGARRHLKLTRDAAVKKEVPVTFDPNFTRNNTARKVTNF